MNYSKELFIELMDEFKKNYDANQADINKTKDVLTVDFMCEITARHHKLIIKLIENMFYITDEWLEWFCFEINFGRDSGKCSIDGKQYIISSAEDMWNFLKELNDDF